MRGTVRMLHRASLIVCLRSELRRVKRWHGSRSEHERLLSKQTFGTAVLLEIRAQLAQLVLSKLYPELELAITRQP